ncbi:MAG: DNA polymerase IV, partial [Lentisphaerota bacterium]
MGRIFIHVDMDAFFTSVEQRDHPELKGKPVVVGSPPDQRGVVSAASYEARKFGVHSAMPSVEAGRLCPHAVFLPVDMKRYAQVSRQVFKILERFTPEIEPLSIDEAFLDVTGSTRLYGSGKDIAEQIRKAIREETGLTASAGVAPNKFLAKVASDFNKPDGITLVPEDAEGIRNFLAPLPVHTIWGVGKVTRKQLEEAGIKRIADLQNCSLEMLQRVVGKHHALHIKRLAWGEDPREIVTDWEEKSISREHTFAHDCQDQAVLETRLLELVEEVGGDLRAAEKYAGVVHLKLRWKGFETITRQRSIDPACCDNYELRKEALSLFHAQTIDRPVRLIGFGVSGLSREGSRQMQLFDADSGTGGRKEKISHTVDQIRKKFGQRSVQTGRLFHLPSPDASPEGARTAKG